ncbi:MAG: radical SAM protein [Nanoarchaeota archaeon]
MITKAEILWTRKCPLRCSFCAMPNDVERAPVEKMIEGLRRLKDLECGFIAIYGASPLYDFDGLPEYINAAEGMGILTTVIVDGAVSDSQKKLQTLYDFGLRSLTVSYDFFPYDKFSKLKSDKGLELLNWFVTLPDVRDVEIVSVVNVKNYVEILSGLLAGDQKTWFSFDIVHPDRGQPGTKCQGNAQEFLLDPMQIRLFCQTLLKIKRRGYKIHQSEMLLKFMGAHPEVVARFGWKCSNKEFPSWLTIDADGTVLPCDDFHTIRDYKVWDLGKKEFEDFTRVYKKEVAKYCLGCFWTTHYDAWLIKKGKVKFGEYVHEV